MTERADVHTVRCGLAASREKAQALIRAGRVVWEGRTVEKPAQPVPDDAVFDLQGEAEQAYASRGGYKLEKAVQAFGADVRGAVAMDVGAAAGGFTDVLLRHGAAHVYAIDVGYGQLEARLRADERVTVMERTNARNLTREQIALQPNLTVMDVSFISIRLILPTAARIMGNQGRFLTLVKPQFEAGRGGVGKNGVVRDAAVHQRVLDEICAFAPSFGWHVAQLTYSPVKGPAGNVEFLADIQPGTEGTVTEKEIMAVTRAAHQALR
ncbi:MAG: TlyA family RNA methyltransferase [Clostridiales bacterium]|nr:TlyA family RNA methyltransferase [Clostridiales bacterium]